VNSVEGIRFKLNYLGRLLSRIPSVPPMMRKDGMIRHELGFYLVRIP
jgi:hypothetical protein